MDSRLKELLKKYNLLLKYREIHGPGYLAHLPGDAPDMVVVPVDASDEHVKNVVLHELGHKLNDNDVMGNYKDDYLAHIKSEDLANDFKTKMMVEDYAKQGYEISAVNYVDLAHAIGTQNFDMVIRELLKHNKKSPNAQT